MTRVLIADDHPLMLSGIASVLLGTAYEAVALLNDGESVLEQLPLTRPDILILDINMPGRTGLEILRTLRSRGDSKPVVLLTAALRDGELVEALRLGVNGIMLKEGAQSLLTTCLDQVRAGGKWIDRSLLERGLELTLTGDGGSADPLSLLTPRERAIAGLIGKGMRNRDIAQELGLTEGTVKVWLHRIYEKVEVSNRTELAIKVNGSE
jgi:two-component system nitrate/nitrite response regulator NarP